MHLVIDLANQIILPKSIDETIVSWIIRVKKRIRLVLHIAHKMKLSPLFVCDAGYTTDEVVLKWKIRREREVERSIRKIPYCADTIVCELLLELNQNLVFDKRYNADDIIATIAVMHPRNMILSRDMDYFRYDDEILHDRVFYIDMNKEVYKLQKKGQSRSPLSTIRMYFPIFARKCSDLFKIVNNGIYIRGTAYPLAERSKSESMHMATRKFRRMLYKDVVLEIFPVWENGKVLWIEEQVYPSYESFPESALKIYNFIFDIVNGPIDENHKTTAAMMACELIANRCHTSLLKEFRSNFDGL